MVRDLPGQLDDAGKIVLVRRLIKEGLLVRRDGAVADSASCGADVALVSSDLAALVQTARKWGHTSLVHIARTNLLRAACIHRPDVGATLRDR